MSSYKDDRHSDRLSAAANAKKAMLERFRAKPGLEDPAVQERQAARLAISQARDARIAERKKAAEAEAARKLIEAEAEKARLAALEVEAAQERARQAEMDVQTAAQKEVLEAERKAARDAKYAARKARRR
jgi:hypothetical protein